MCWYYQVAKLKKFTSANNWYDYFFIILGPITWLHPAFEKCPWKENLLVKCKSATRGGLGSRYHCLFCVLYMPCLGQFFCPHSPKPCRCTALQMVKITPTVPWYFPPAYVLQNSWWCPSNVIFCMLFSVFFIKLLLR